MTGDYQKVVQPAKDAAEEVFKAYSSALHQYLMRQMRNEADVKDLMQEIFLRYSRVDRDALVRQPDAYLFGIAWRVIGAHRTKAGEECAAFSTEIAEFRPAVREDLAIDELRSQLLRKLSELPVAHRDVLMLHLENDLTYGEISQRLGLSTHTVKKYLFSAKARLRDVLA